MKEFEQCMK